MFTGEGKSADFRIKVRWQSELCYKHVEWSLKFWETWHLFYLVSYEKCNCFCAPLRKNTVFQMLSYNRVGTAVSHLYSLCLLRQ